MSAPQIVQNFVDKNLGGEYTGGLAVIKRLADIAHEHCSRSFRVPQNSLLDNACSLMCAEFEQVECYLAFSAQLRVLEGAYEEWDQCVRSDSAASFHDMKRAFEDHKDRIAAEMKSFEGKSDANVAKRVGDFKKANSPASMKSMALRDFVHGHIAMFPESFSGNWHIPHDFAQISAAYRGKRAMSTLMQAIPLGFALECTRYYKNIADVKYGAKLSQKLHDLKIQDARMWSLVSGGAETLDTNSMNMLSSAVLKKLHDVMRVQLHEKNDRYRKLLFDKECEDECAMIKTLQERILHACDGSVG